MVCREPLEAVRRTEREKREAHREDVREGEQEEDHQGEPGAGHVLVHFSATAPKATTAPIQSREDRGKEPAPHRSSLHLDAFRSDALSAPTRMGVPGARALLDIRRSENGNSGPDDLPFCRRKLREKRELGHGRDCSKPEATRTITHERQSGQRQPRVRSFNIADRESARPRLWGSQPEPTIARLFQVRDKSGTPSDCEREH